MLPEVSPEMVYLLSSQWRGNSMLPEVSPDMVCSLSLSGRGAG